MNAVTSCMLDVSADAEADDRDLNHVPHILARANWMSDLTSDVLDACDDLMRAIRDLIGGERQSRDLVMDKYDEMLSKVSRVFPGYAAGSSEPVVKEVLRPL
jgi:hypothetical protein